MNLLLFEPGELTLDAGDSRYVHLKTVLKKREGDAFAAGIISGKKGTAVIESLTSEKCVCRFFPEMEPSPLFDLTLIVGMVRPITAKRLLKDLTTLGISRLIFAQTELTDKSYRSSTLWRPESVRRFLIEGAAQAGQTRLPSVETAYRVKAALFRLPENAVRVVFDNGPAARPFREHTPFSLPAVAAVGSERGWTDAERRLFAEAGFSFSSMGARVLRTETAAVVAAALLLEKSGVWS